MQKIAALLTVFNRREKTLMCLHNLFAQTLPAACSLDVYLTNDGCTDGTPEAVTERFPTVRIIQGDGNLYWNRGMHLAWETASQAFDYDHYLWINDDTYLFPRALAQLVADAGERPDSVIVGCTCANGDTSVITYGGRVRNRLLVPNGQLQKCDTFNGNIVLVSRAVFAAVGNLDWTYRHAIGDLDYGCMVRRTGMGVYLSGTVLGQCDKNPRPPQWMRTDVPFRERWRNFHSPLAYGQPGPMFHYLRKNFSLALAVRVWITNHIRVCFPWIKKT